MRSHQVSGLTISKVSSLSLTAVRKYGVTSETMIKNNETGDGKVDLQRRGSARRRGRFNGIDKWSLVPLR